MRRSGRTFSWMLALALALNVPHAAQAGSKFGAPTDFLEGSPVARTAGASYAAHNDLDGPLNLVWVDVDEIATFAYERAFGEARAVLEGAGLRYHYSRGDAALTTGPDDVRVIILKRSAVPAASRHLVMGAVNARFAMPGEARAVWVYLDPIVAALGFATAAENGAAVATAMGRVIAHEIVHVMAPQLGHAKKGLMAATLTQRDLIGPRGSVSGTFIKALRPATTSLASARYRPADREPRSADRR